MSRHSAKGAAWDRAARAVKERDGHRCVACGATDDLTVDHIVPISTLTTEDLVDGVHLDPDNLATLCRPCNSSKGDRPHLRVTWVNPRWLASLVETGSFF